MSEHILIALGIVVMLGFGAQWLSWRTGFPSIVLLLVSGIVVGPVLGYIRPDDLFGEVLIPFVSLSVAIILFEGGLTLKLDEFRKIGKVVTLLISAGALISWITTALAAHWVFGINYQIAILLGAVLTVTGPTVIGPMLRNIRPRPAVANTLKWEGILIDPIGAMLAILVFEGILIGGVQQAAVAIVLSLLKTIFLGIVVGGSFALLLTFLIKKYWIPDFLHEVAALAFVVAAFLISNIFQEESGLLSATIMGVVLANQKHVPVKNIKDFKENLTVLMIPVLFILLSARLTMSDIELMGWKGFLLLAILILVGRPLSVFISTFRSNLKFKEKAFIAGLAPRGIVAAAVSSVFALKLAENNLPQIEYLVPVTFLVIIGTVTIYGLAAPLIARVLGITQSDPKGVLIAGAHDWSLDIARTLQENGFRVLVVDTSRHKVNTAKMQGIEAYHESIIAEKVIDRLDLEGIGKLLALTSNDEVNALGVLHFSEIFDNENLYQLQPYTKADEREFSPQHLSGRFLFGKEITFDSIEKMYADGATIKSTNLTEAFTYSDFQKKHGENHIPLFLVDGNHALLPFTSGGKLTPGTGHTIVALVSEKQ